MLYKFLSGLAKGVTHCIFRVKVVGKENVPKDGGMILAVNHKSNWDPIFAGAYCPRPLRFMAKADLFKNKLFGGLIKKLGAFSILKNNDAMLIFPEGHRIKNGKRVKAKLGVSMIAVYAKVPVIPLCISGEYKPFHKVTVTFGKPITFEEYYGKKPDNETLQTLADEVMQTIYSFDNTDIKKIGEQK